MLSLLTHTSSKIFCPTFAEKQKEIEETGNVASHFLKGIRTSVTMSVPQNYTYE
jgi:hypothetical protein